MFAPSMLMACGGLVPGALVQGREGRCAAEKLAAEKLAAEKLAVEKRAVEKRAVEKLLRKLILTQSRTPRVMVTDKPGSGGAARVGMRMNIEHRQHKGLNNRAKNAHRPTLRLKRIIKRFTSARHLKHLVSIHDPIANLQTVPATPYRHPAIGRFVPGRWSRGARSPNRASPRSARGKRPVFAWPPVGKLTVPRE
jgi:hypothetical protein